MNVVYAYVTPRREVLERIFDDLSARVVFADTSSSPSRYLHRLQEVWRRGWSFILVEEDKLPAAGALRVLWDCPEPWCAYPVPMRDTEECAPFPTLSCTKFDASLMQEQPDLMDRVGELDLGCGAEEWSRLDVKVAALLGATRQVHWHPAGMVRHLHEVGSAHR